MVRRKRMDWGRPERSEESSFAVGGSVAHNADARRFSWPARCDVLVFDPPWNERELWDIAVPEYESALVFCDGKYASTAITRFGSPRWIFVWDTMSTWSSSKNQPLNGCKFCLLYSDSWNRDEALYGEPPPAKKHPSTTYQPAPGRRLSDLYRKSIRWLSNAKATGKSDTPPHMKPDEWVTALVAGVAVKGGTLVDPFMGGGSSIVAASASGMSALATEIDPSVFAFAKNRLLSFGDKESVAEMPLFREEARVS